MNKRLDYVSILIACVPLGLDPFCEVKIHKNLPLLKIYYEYLRFIFGYRWQSWASLNKNYLTEKACGAKKNKWK